MTKNILLATTCLVVGATSASALEFTGATIGADYTAYTSSGLDEVTSLGFSSELEFSLAPSFSMALNISRESFDVDGAPFDLTSSDISLHGIYSVNDAVKVGAFVAQSSFFYYDSDSYGVEAAYDGGSYNVAGYIGAADFEIADETMTLFGLNGDYGFANGFGVQAAVDVVDFQDFDLTVATSTIGATYDFGNGVSISADLGRIDIDDTGSSDEETFVSVGTTFAFGPEGGTTFKTPKGFDLFFF
ncbi:hypothetical protein DS901_09235 [Loktanella sp. D2R18]|uniref:hypothetical protein n=1 Tax=Rhodobacterales TaxID=204455 RepID=UPI000DE8F4EE|nr:MULTISPECIES: hypothetical protein [Rhodobacterales]MDO6591574.1 hypothetical protein [Yoonia sp. 1_MG-2023]RBW43693.1 hypothetical protein DS901_09235 [Loktanella sp. D2R18]